MAYPRRGEIWLADLRPARGREQSGRRPVLVLSVDFFNAGPADLVVVLPLTSTQRDLSLHVKVSKGDGATRNDRVILCEAIRSVSKDRLISRWVCCHTRSWLRLKIVCAFCLIFEPATACVSAKSLFVVTAGPRSRQI
jgi:mRNA interferase MazF